MPTPQVAYQQLLEVRYFAFGGVGFAPVTSEGEMAYRAIVGSTNGLELFSTALTNGNPHTKLYALCGLRQLAPERFEAAADSIARTNSQVITASGCLVGPEPASNVVHRISHGYYDKYLTWPKS